MFRTSPSRSLYFATALAGIVLLPAARLPAQAASYTYLDQKAPFKNWNPPGLTALNLPKLGAMFEFEMPGNPWWPHSSTYRLAVGLSNPNVPVPALGGYLYTSAEVVMLAPLKFTPGRMVTVQFPVPNSSQWLGVQFYQQVVVVPYCSYGNCPSQPSLSRAGVGVFGR